VGTAAVIAVYYFAYFCGLGFFWPYLGPILRSFGLSAADATRVIALGPLCGLCLPPLFGLIADATGRRRTLVRALSAGATLAFAGLLFGDRSAAVVVVTVL
jgi:PPP family 3-phenylpropionic acid transporter